jgi:eukaryotic-like serine/threonine-protein kinase
LALAPGTLLGPYEIASPLGAGGMGEVYRARDSRLGRDAAIKVLPATLASDAERLRRFEREARAASSLNHPAIVTIYEIGKADGVTYLAMELVDGVTLRELLAEGPLPVRRLISVSAQIADGLAKAHGAGIVHRDLKPENLMVTKDGFVKILDFGLAKMAAAEPEEGQQTAAATVSAATEPGVVMGTVAYMSPEQARGGALDFRSDQFALGSVLYEMATGRRAFAGETRPEVLTAIIREEPEPVAVVSPKIPAPVRWIIERCLAKGPGDRYASTEDLARDLRSAEAHLSELTGVSGAGSPATPAPTRRPLRLAAIALAAVILGVAGAWLVARRSVRNAAVPSFVRVTFQRGNIFHGRFAPDGQTVLYSASLEGSPAEIYSTRVDGTESRPLGLKKADLLAVSGSGELLVLVGSDTLKSPGGAGTLARVPLSGGAPRDLVEKVHAADWLAGGAVAVQRHIDIDHDELQIPAGTRRLDYNGSAPRSSRDGRLVAIARRTAAGGEVVVLDDAGKLLWSAPADTLQVAWHPSGEVWYSRDVGSEPGLYAVSRGGKTKPVLRASGWVLHDIAPDGRLLLERAIARQSLRVRLAGDAKERELSWLDGSTLVGVSTERGALLFSETYEAGTRAGGVYLRALDGSPAVRLADGTAAAFSEDGRSALVRSVGSPARYSIVPSSAGQPVALDLGGANLVAATFLPGSEPRLLATIGESGDRGEVAIITTKGVRKLGISPGFTDGAVVVSPDGGSFAYRTGIREIAVCPLEEPSCRKITLPGDEAPIQWSADGRFLYLRAFGIAIIPVQVTRYEIATGAVSDWRTLGPEDATDFIAVGGVFVSRDGKSYAYDAQAILDSSLFVVDGLR